MAAVGVQAALPTWEFQVSGHEEGRLTLLASGCQLGCPPRGGGSKQAGLAVPGGHLGFRCGP